MIQKMNREAERVSSAAPRKPRMSWTPSSLPRQDGRVIVVTGANSGIGWEASKMLASAGAHVVMACRSPERAEAARSRLLSAVPAASLELMRLDLASLQSVRDFAGALAERHPKVSVLVNNAGVMALPRTLTADGFEMQLGTNHLGHFALTGLLLPLLLAIPDGRVVTVASHAHRMGSIDFEDLQREKRYERWSAYGQSKLANLLFAFTLDRRLRAARLPLLSVACHPGYSDTALQTAGAKMEGSKLSEHFFGTASSLFAQSAEKGALPTVYAAAGGEVEGGDYVGPGGFLEIWGKDAVKVKPSRAALDVAVGDRLWEVSERLTGVSFTSLAPARA